MLTVGVFLLLPLASYVSCDQECLKHRTKCFYDFTVGSKLTMMNGADKVFLENGKLYKYDVTNTSEAEPIPTRKVITADGWAEPREILVVNGKFPGPSIIVYEGQTVVIKVTNELETQAVTLHWHGLHQVGTPWMDGVPFINQCPIGPGQTYKYVFTPTQTGTFWWHSHVGSQRSDGIYGAFIIRKRSLPDADEKIMMVQDWNHNDGGRTFHNKVELGFYDGLVRFQKYKSLDGGTYGNVLMHSALINGKGRYEESGGTVVDSPVTIYKVYQNGKVRFRVINAAMYYPFRISVDDHEITVESSDGYDLDPYTAESVVMWPGERYDFTITADQPVDNYWIRGMMMIANNQPIALAILRYAGAGPSDPTTSRRNCTESHPCVVLNCPFLYYPAPNTICRTFGDFKARNNKHPAPNFNEKKSKNYFLNFGFPGDDWKPASINGRTFHTPDVNPLIQPKEWQSTCDKRECGKDKICKCTHTLNINKEMTVQMVISNLGSGGNNVGHVMHLHGHSFHVIKYGFGTYNEVTGQWLEPTDDIDCGDQRFCNKPKWTDKSWNSGNIPGSKLKRAPIKDSIGIPAGGYVVVRFKADNPGLWLMHCHQDSHDILGMRLVLNETFSEYPQAPRTLPICHSYPATEYRKHLRSYYKP